jgi:hypothetical protein
MQLSIGFAVVTPTRRAAETSPLKGEVKPSTPSATPGKSVVGLLSVTWPGRWKVPVTK